MALQKREKKMLIALGIVAVVSGIILYRVFNPAEEEIEQLSTAPKTEEAASTTSGGSRGGSRGGGGGGSRGGGGSGTTTGGGLSSADFQKHVSLEDCWVLVEGTVYDITGILQEYSQYGPTVAPFCGTFGFEVGFLQENLSLKEIIIGRAPSHGQIK